MVDYTKIFKTSRQLAAFMMLDPGQQRTVLHTMEKNNLIDPELLVCRIMARGNDAASNTTGTTQEKG